MRELAAAAQREESSGTPTPTPLPSRRSQSDTSFYNRLAEEISHEAEGDDAFFGTWAEVNTQPLNSAIIEMCAICKTACASYRPCEMPHQLFALPYHVASRKRAPSIHTDAKQYESMCAKTLLRMD